MANKQLVEYIKEQLAHKADINQVRTILAQQGWLQQDIEAAIQEAYKKKHEDNIKKHHTNFIAIIILVIIILIITTALFMVVFKNEEGTNTTTNKEQITSQEQGKTITEPITNHQNKNTINNEENQAKENNNLSGWAVCAADKDSEEKNNCYKKLNEENKDYDCDKIKNNEERTFCYRAKELILIQEYEKQQATSKA